MNLYRIEFRQAEEEVNSVVYVYTKGNHADAEVKLRDNYEVSYVYESTLTASNDESVDVPELLVCDP